MPEIKPNFVSLTDFGNKMRLFGLMLVVLSVFAQYASGMETQELEPIVVTAKKMDADIQDVPMSLSVINARTISETRAVQVEDLADLVPNLSMGQEQASESFQRITIRGVGAFSRNIGFDTRVGVYLDGVYMGQSPALNVGLYNLERVEVLRGPQGTLYGKNTVAGAINLISEKPHTGLESSFTLEAGSLDYIHAQASVNFPLIKEKLFAKATVLQTKRNGTYTNLVDGADLNNRKTNAFRFQVAGNLGGATQLYVGMDGMHSRRDTTFGDPLTDTFAVIPEMAAPGDFDVSYNVTPREDRDLFGISATLSHDFADGLSLVSVSGYRDTRIEFRNDLDYSSADLATLLFRDKYRQASQEIRLQSPPSGRITYTAGLYYEWQDAWTYRTVTFGEDIVSLGDPGLIPGNTVPNTGDVVTRSYAVFLDGEYRLTEKLGAEAGFRYTWETKDADFFLDGSDSGFFNIPVWDFVSTYSDGAFTPSASLTYRFSDGITGYVTFGTGFKSGGFNLDWLTAADVAAGVEYGKETVTNYEAGLKLALPVYQLRANLAVFRARYKNFQVQQFIDMGNDLTAISIKNAAKATSRGMEIEINANPAAPLFIDMAISLLDATFDEFPGGGLEGSDASGNQLPFAPHFTARIGAEYQIPVSSIPATLSIRGDYFYTDDYYTQVSNVRSHPLLSGGSVPYSYMESYGLLSGRVALDSDSGGWSVYLWAKNILDEKYVTDSYRDFFGTIVAVRGMPRTFGVGASLRF